MTREEFSDFLEREGGDLYAFCRMLMGNADAADELYQDTMLKAVGGCGGIDGLKNPKSYLIGISLGLYRNHRRSLARRQRIAPRTELTDELSAVLADKTETPEEAALRRELRELVRRETERLPEKLRQTVYLYYTAQLSVEEIAGVLHIPKGTVKSRLHKARSLIKQGLEGYGYEA